jgi:hypothetical protein
MTARYGSWCSKTRTANRSWPRRCATPDSACGWSAHPSGPPAMARTQAARPRDDRTARSRRGRTVGSLVGAGRVNVDGSVHRQPDRLRGRRWLFAQGDAERCVHGVECPDAQTEQCSDNGGWGQASEPRSAGNSGHQPGAEQGDRSECRDVEPNDLDGDHWSGRSSRCTRSTSPKPQTTARLPRGPPRDRDEPPRRAGRRPGAAPATAR